MSSILSFILGASGIINTASNCFDTAAGTLNVALLSDGACANTWANKEQSTINVHLRGGVIVDDSGRTCYVSDSQGGKLICKDSPPWDNHIGSFMICDRNLYYQGQPKFWNCKGSPVGEVTPHRYDMLKYNSDFWISSIVPQMLSIRESGNLYTKPVNLACLDQSITLSDVRRNISANEGCLSTALITLNITQSTNNSFSVYPG